MLPEARQYGLANDLGGQPLIDRELAIGRDQHPVGYAAVRAAVDWRRIGMEQKSTEPLSRVIDGIFKDFPAVAVSRTSTVLNVTGNNTWAPPSASTTAIAPSRRGGVEDLRATRPSSPSSKDAVQPAPEHPALCRSDPTEGGSATATQTEPRRGRTHLGVSVGHSQLTRSTVLPDPARPGRGFAEASALGVRDPQHRRCRGHWATLS